jgi:hypothetical protein
MAAVIEEFASAPIIASDIFDYGFGQAPERLCQGGSFCSAQAAHPIFEKVSREIKQGSGVPFCPRMETLNGKPVIRKPKGQNERTGRNTKCRQAEGPFRAGVEILNRGLGLPAAQVDVDVCWSAAKSAPLIEGPRDAGKQSTCAPASSRRG